MSRGKPEKTENWVQAHAEAVRRTHSCTPRYEHVIRVIEEFEGERVWERDVYVFALEGHPSAKKAYAWSVPVPESERRRFYAVLHEGPVDSPEKAVRAAIVKEVREERGGRPHSA